MNRDTIWTNADGLAVGFGTRDVEQTGSAKLSVGGDRQQVRFRIKLADLTDTTVGNQLINAPSIPAGAILETARLFVESAAVGVNAVLDIGLAKTADGAIIDDDYVDAAIATATLVDGYTVLCDGAAIGTELAFNSKVYASYDTAAFTSGVVVVTLEYVVPAV